MEKYKERMLTRSKARTDIEEPAVIKYITNDPMKRSWSEVSSNWNYGPSTRKSHQHSHLLEHSKEHEHKALLNASRCLEKICSMTQPISLPPIRTKDLVSGQIHWIYNTSNHKLY
ncbi:hypothetical protein EB796_009077 [Bugula neritina]|uniref:Uncharacterized protein n=1 Tax=Bugula neritina TaxID=10212 RepID=A0A7J7K341_BUGNE|nr:hypothetical protein EB796_009077 [Bugula neritina]